MNYNKNVTQVSSAMNRPSVNFINQNSWRNSSVGNF